MIPENVEHKMPIPTAIASAPHQFIPSLHGVRGLAILIVLLSHIGNNGFFLIPIWHDYIGKVGVWIFFVLSAFLLTSRLCQELKAGSPLAPTLAAYFIQRFFRIYPLLLFAIALNFIVGNISVVGVIENALLIEGYRDHWAIPVEFKYYFVIPVVALAATYLPYRTVIWALVLSVVVSTVYGTLYPTTVFSVSLSLLLKLSPFLVGSIAALFMERSFPTPWQLQSRFSAVQFVPLILLLILTVLCREVSMTWTPSSASPWSSLIAMAMGVTSAVIIYTALRWQSMHTFFGSRWMVFLGEISFSLYLLHPLIIQAVKTLTAGRAPFIGAWIIFTVSLLLASVSYWTVERPGVRVGRFLSDWAKAMRPSFTPPSVAWLRISKTPADRKTNGM